MSNIRPELPLFISMAEEREEQTGDADRASMESPNRIPDIISNKMVLTTSLRFALISCTAFGVNVTRTSYIGHVRYAGCTGVCAVGRRFRDRRAFVSRAAGNAPAFVLS